MSLIKCNECGKETTESAVICPNCGAKNKDNNKKASFGIKLICFLIPIVGIILCITKMATKPKYAKGCLIASLISLIAIVAIVIISALITMGFYLS